MIELLFWTQLVTYLIFNPLSVTCPLYPWGVPGICMPQFLKIVELGWTEITIKSKSCKVERNFNTLLRFNLLLSPSQKE